jgi:uncharacterized protein
MDGTPAVEGFFDPATATLIGSRCTGCGTYAFPAREGLCPNPSCLSEETTRVPLSRRGTVWSFTSASYQPPTPYVAADPFVPFAIVAVELAEEQLVVLGQMVSRVSTADLSVGMTVEVVTDELYTDDEGTKLVWKFQPVEDGR